MSVEKLSVGGLVDVSEEHLLTNGDHQFEARGFEYKELGEDLLPVLSGVLVAQDDPDAMPVFHTVWLPREEQSEDEYKRAVRDLRRFLNAFGVGWNKKGEFDIGEINSKTAIGKSRQKVNKHTDEMEVKIKFPRIAE